MTVLVACLGEGKGTWGHVARVIDAQKWDSVFLITNDFGKEKFDNTRNAELIVVAEGKGIKELTEDIRSALDGKLVGDVAVNFVSGAGKEHMALLSALLKLGAGIRLVALTKDGLEEI